MTRFSSFRRFGAAFAGIWLLVASVSAMVGEPSLVRGDGAVPAEAVTLAHNGVVAPLVVDAKDWPGVQRAARNVATDFELVTGTKAPVADAIPSSTRDVVLAGTIGRSTVIDALVAAKKLDVSAIAGRWEAFQIEVVTDPAPGVARALVIAGSDKRGTTYGLYALSQQIGVSPWAWWADVPARKRATLFAIPGRIVETGPAVKYRGIFLNDEAPALAGWANEKFGGLNAKFYERVFELILRLRGNYLWPAMWNNAFNEDDPANAVLADEMGIVMGTSHHEPMLRAHKEWAKHGKGPWNFQKNAEVLKQFWAEGVRRNRAFESLITVGMRGDGDEPMSEEANVALLQNIVATQREILARETGKSVEQVPQLWALYKEVQEYFEKGMRVPDDVTLLWCDDNWGNIRRLPTAEERKRPGGAGVYYHFDYVGGPRNYKWLNTSPITKTWEQMHLAWEYGADRIWIVNVGDLKPMEYPIEFFLTLAWSPAAWPAERIGEFGRLWAARDFDPIFAAEIESLVNGYTRLNGRRKPELLSPETFSILNYREADRVVDEWRDLVKRAEWVSAQLRPEARDAFFQLVQWPILACANVNELHVVVARNRLAAAQGRASTNRLAARARELFATDAELTRRYNEELTGGKWRHFADQTHLGYTYWQQPPVNVLPAVHEVQVLTRAELGVAVEGVAAPHDSWQWPARVPPIDAFAQPTRWIDVFNRGAAPLRFTTTTGAPWLRVSPAEGDLANDVRLEVSVDWSIAPKGRSETKVTVRGSDGRDVGITVPVFNPEAPTREAVAGFVESDGVVAIEAAHYHRALGGADNAIRWQTIPGYGRVLSAVTPFPVTAPSQSPAAGSASPRLEYDVQVFSPGEVKVELQLAPTLPFVPGRGIRLAVSFDDAAPQVLEIKGEAGEGRSDWERTVSDAVRRLTSKHVLAAPGGHMLKVWMIDPGIVLERIVIDCGGLKPSYLGPPESFRR